MKLDTIEYFNNQAASAAAWAAEWSARFGHLAVQHPRDSIDSIDEVAEILRTPPQAPRQADHSPDAGKMVYPDMLSDRELQTLRNQGNEAETAADEIERLRGERKVLADLLLQADPVYDRSVVARIATQMGWTPPTELTEHERKPPASAVRISQESINCWRVNYGLDKRTPAGAMCWWSERANGMAPAGAVAALGLCLQEIERLLCSDRKMQAAKSIAQDPGRGEEFVLRLAAELDAGDPGVQS